MTVLMSNSDCDETQKADAIQTSQQEKLIEEAIRQVGMPNTPNWQQLRFMKLIIEMCDQSNVINYVYTKAEMTGKLVFQFKCVGFGLPYATQFTNPLKVVHGANYSITTIAQCDPDGLFKPASAAGTWLLAINPQTHQPTVSYMEDNVNVLGFPLNPEDGVNTVLDSKIDVQKVLIDALEKLKAKQVQQTPVTAVKTN
jgi:hypothetical protein